MIQGLGLSLSTMEINGNNRDSLKKACSEVESMFLYMMLKEMDKNLGENDLLFGGKEEQIFRDIRDIELSRYLSERSVFGMGDLLYKSLEKFV